MVEEVNFSLVVKDDKTIEHSPHNGHSSLTTCLSNMICIVGFKLFIKVLYLYFCMNELSRMQRYSYNMRACIYSWHRFETLLVNLFDALSSPSVHLVYPVFSCCTLCSFCPSHSLYLHTMLSLCTSLSLGHVCWYFVLLINVFLVHLPFFWCIIDDLAPIGVNWARISTL